MDNRFGRTFSFRRYSITGKMCIFLAMATVFILPSVFCDVSDTPDPVYASQAQSYDVIVTGDPFPYPTN